MAMACADYNLDCVVHVHYRTEKDIIKLRTSVFNKVHLKFIM